ncbi:MAG: hypothetical protein HXS54_04225 [Theionarchaea archaeon]|nr:hypothetical protein [Theionarchaea archaeon]
MNLEEVLDVFRTDEDKAKLLAMQIANDRGREVGEDQNQPLKLRVN